MTERPRTALITGAAGFCGSYLGELLLGQGVRVVGVDRVASSGAPYRFESLDLRDEAAVRRIVAETRPDWLVHLAALTDPAAPAGDLYEVNVLATIRLLEVVQTAIPDCTVLIAGSSAQYGLTRPDENPITEAQLFRPVTQYAVSKATQDMVGGMASAAGLPVIRTRTFNIVGPRQSPAFVTAAFARQIAEIEHGLREPVIEVGNLAAQRDFVDVRDVARAYWLALERGRAGAIYNVCSGQGRRIQELLDGLLALSTVRDIEVRRDPQRLQPADVPAQVGSYDRLRADTGWQPQIPWEQSLRDLLDYWRASMNTEQ